MGMHRATVRQWLGAGSFPERAQRQVTSRTDRFLDYLRRRWDEGCHNAAQLTREIQDMGFGGTAVMVRRRVAPWRRGERTGCRPQVDSIRLPSGVPRRDGSFGGCSRRRPSENRGNGPWSKPWAIAAPS
jgi:transposase